MNTNQSIILSLSLGLMASACIPAGGTGEVVIIEDDRDTGSGTSDGGGEVDAGDVADAQVDAQVDAGEAEPDVRADVAPVEYDGLRGHVLAYVEDGESEVSAFFADETLEGFAMPAECTSDTVAWVEPGTDAASPGVDFCPPDSRDGVTATVNGVLIDRTKTIPASVAGRQVVLKGGWGDASPRLPASPDPPVVRTGVNSNTVFSNQAGVVFEWEPGEAGSSVYVLTDSLVDNQVQKLLFKFEDDGEAVIPRRAYWSPTSSNDEKLSYQMWRTNRETIELGGREIALETRATTSGRFSISMAQGSRLDAPITCADAEQAELLADGVYYGHAEGTQDLIDPGEVCIRDGDVIGGFTSEGVWRVMVDAGQTLDVRLRTLDVAPALYLLTDCTQEDSCVVGASEGLFGDDFDTISWKNEGDVGRQVYLVIDGVSAGNTLGAFELDVSRD